LPATTPIAVRKLIERCLRKNPHERIHDVSDVRIEIQEALNESADVVHVREKGWRGRLLMSLAVVVVILAVAGVWYFRREPRQEAPLKVVPLTSNIGTQRQPSLSPDGREVAFSWNGEKQDNFDIYVQMVSGGSPQRLTTDPAPDSYPVWSPDANQIAFLRNNSVYLISPRGGAERYLCRNSGWLAWSPDGKSIAIRDRDSETEPFAIFMVSVETGKRQRMTSPPAKFWGDTQCAFSPDGKNVVFARQPSQLSNDAYILPLANGAPKGEPWRLTNDSSWIVGFAWTPDSREIVFSSTRGGRTSLWRIIPSPGAEPQRIPGTDDGGFPAISKGPPTRLAYQRSYQDINIWRMEIPHSPNINNSTTQIIASSATERDPQFSPDGTRVAFTSERSGYPAIWLAAGDGSNPTPLTSFAGSRTAGAPSWSPDGRQIVFDSMAGGYLDIFVLNPENRVSRQLTDDHAFNARPSWSRDGRWIYFGSNKSGIQQVWKISPDGGNPQQLTKDGGFEAVEAPDGKELYYTKTYNLAPGLWRVPVEGGREAPVIEAVRSGHWAVTDQGIYFLDFSAVPAAAPKPLLKFFSFETQKVSQHGTIEKIRISSDASFSVSRDGRSVIWRQLDRSESNIMLIDKFR
jgi:Tol biopolymer transport system component